jgi:hypothetical protein
MTMCTFCCYGACENCSKKKRFFPFSEVKNKLHELRGTVCKQCDRKFFIRIMVDGTKREIDTNNSAIQSIKTNKTKIKTQLKDDTTV